MPLEDITPCQCEHESHMLPPDESFTPNNRVGHGYGKVVATIIAKTKMGTFRVCVDCMNDCMVGQIK